LRILDTFLNEQNSEALIKDAIRIAKPYFFANILQPRLEQESRKVFDAFKAEATANDVLHYYMMNTRYPEMRTLPFFERLQNYQEERDKVQYLEAMHPDLSRNFALKNMIAKMGSDFSQVNSAADLEKATRQEY